MQFFVFPQNGDVLPILSFQPVVHKFLCFILSGPYCWSQSPWSKNAPVPTDLNFRAHSYLDYTAVRIYINLFFL